MRRRIWLALTAVAAASLAVSAGMAVAAGAKTTTSATKPTLLRCKVSLTTEPPNGSNAVSQPASQGSQYGSVHCPKPAGFGGGVAADSFTVPDSGDTVGKYTEYFNAGTITGAFDLTPQESNFTTTSFESQTWQGTVKVISGTGIYKGIKGKKKGVMTCSSPDSVHLTCQVKVKVLLPAGFVGG